MTEIRELFDLTKTIAADLFAGKTYPWEVLADIRPFILRLGETRMDCEGCKNLPVRLYRLTLYY